MSVKITTGEYTQIVVTNKKHWAEILTATEFNADASAKTEEVRAFNDLGEPLVISTDMGQTTGRISIIRSNTIPFETLAMGLVPSYTGTPSCLTAPKVSPVWDASGFIKFTLKDAITHPMFLIANFKDKITGLIYGSQWITNAFLNSDGTNEAVNGTLATTFSYTATGKYSFAKAIAIGPKAAYDADVSAGKAVVSPTAVWTESDGTNHYFLPGGTDDNGEPIDFSFNMTTGVNETPAATSLLAWLTTTGM